MTKGLVGRRGSDWIILRRSITVEGDVIALSWEYSTLGRVERYCIIKSCMHAASSRVEKSAQVSSYKLEFIHDGALE